MSVLFSTRAAGQVGAARRHHREGVRGPAGALPCGAASPVSGAGAAQRAGCGAIPPSQKGAFPAVFITLMRKCMACVKGHCIIFVCLLLLYRQEHRVRRKAPPLPVPRGASSVLRGAFPATHSRACSQPRLPKNIQMKSPQAQPARHHRPHR